MHDPLDDVLRLVAEGRLSPQDAAPIIDALASARTATARARAAADHARAAGRAVRDAGESVHDALRGGHPPEPPRPPTPPGPPRRLRVLVRDGGRIVVDLQLPGILAELAGAVPGIPADYVDRIREALRSGVRGPVVDVADEDGSGVTITID